MPQPTRKYLGHSCKRIRLWCAQGNVFPFQSGKQGADYGSKSTDEWVPKKHKEWGILHQPEVRIPTSSQGKHFWKTKMLWNGWPQPLYLYSVSLRERVMRNLGYKWWGSWGIKSCLLAHTGPWEKGRGETGQLGEGQAEKRKKHSSHYSLQEHPTFPSHSLPWLLLFCPPEQLQWAWGIFSTSPPLSAPVQQDPLAQLTTHTRHCWCPGEPNTARTEQWAD